MYRLRELARTDLKTVNRWRNDPELISMLGAPFRYINLSVDEKWFETYMQSRNAAIRCVIVDEKDEAVGLISLTDVDYMNQSAELHIMIGDKANRGKGIGTFALGEMLRHAFCNMNLRRIGLAVLEDNKHARKLYEKAGFKEEGVMREARYKDGKFVNMVTYAVLRDDIYKGNEGFSGGYFDKDFSGGTS